MLSDIVNKIYFWEGYVLSRVNAADFYYGAVLSVMLSRGVVPALFQESTERRLYELTTDKDEYRLYLKYRSAPCNQSVSSRLWNFSFSMDEIQLIKQYKQNRNLNVRFG